MHDVTNTNFFLKGHQEYSSTVWNNKIEVDIKKIQEGIKTEKEFLEENRNFALLGDLVNFYWAARLNSDAEHKAKHTEIGKRLEQETMDCSPSLVSLYSLIYIAQVKSATLPEFLELNKDSPLNNNQDLEEFYKAVCFSYSPNSLTYTKMKEMEKTERPFLVHSDSFTMENLTLMIQNTTFTNFDDFSEYLQEHRLIKEVYHYLPHLISFYWTARINKEENLNLPYINSFKIPPICSGTLIYEVQMYHDTFTSFYEAHKDSLYTRDELLQLFDHIRISTLDTTRDYSYDVLPYKDSDQVA